MLALPIIHALRLDFARLIDEARQGARLALPDLDPSEIDALIDAREGPVGQHRNLHRDALAPGMELGMLRPAENPSNLAAALPTRVVVVLHELTVRVVERPHDLGREADPTLERGARELLGLKRRLARQSVIIRGRRLSHRRPLEWRTSHSESPERARGLEAPVEIRSEERRVGKECKWRRYRQLGD